jgi:hypothetical protein
MSPAAGTVGFWLIEMRDARDMWSLEDAAALEQAMPITSIVRDLGETSGSQA